MDTAQLIALARKYPAPPGLHRSYPASAADWIEQWASSAQPQEAWSTCPRGEFMLRIAVAAGVDRKTIVRAVCDCAKLSLSRVQPDEQGYLPHAITAAEAWMKDEEDIGAVRVVEAIAIRCSFYRMSPLDFSAIYVSYTVHTNAANAGFTAAYALYATYSCAVSCGGAELRTQVMQRCADIVRETIPFSIVEAAAAMTPFSPQEPEP